MFSPVFAGRLLAELLDRLAVVLVAVDVRLVEQRDLLAPLGELALDDPLADVLGLALLGGLLLEDGRARRRLVLGGSPRPRRSGSGRGDVQGDRRRRTRLEVVVAGDEVGLALDLDEPPILPSRGRRRRRRPRSVERPLRFGRGRLTLDAEDLDGLVEVAPGLGQRRLAVHHRRAGALAERLDVRGLDLGRRSLGAAFGGAAGGRGGLRGSRVGAPRPAASAPRPARERSRCSAAPRRLLGRPRPSRRPLPPAFGLFLLALLALLLLALRALLLLALAPGLLGLPGRRSPRSGSPRRACCTISSQERIASSLPGITYSTGRGLQLVSTTATIGMSRRTRLVDRDLLGVQVDHEDRIRRALHVADAAEVELELLELGLAGHPLLGRQQGELAVRTRAR